MGAPAVYGSAPLTVISSCRRQRAKNGTREARNYPTKPYDYRNVGHLNSNQIGLGFETLGKVIDFRINGYLPVGAKMGSPYDAIFGAFSGHHMLVSQKYQSAMKGSNAELGLHFGKSKFFDFFAAVGPYYFVGKHAPSIWGGKARIAATFKDFFTLEISDSYDRTFRNKFQGEISFGFALGPKSKVRTQDKSCHMAGLLNDRMLQKVDRQEIIVIDTIRQNSVAIDPATGLPYFFVFVDNTSSSDGIYESPFHNFAGAQESSSERDILYVFPGDGTTRGMNSGITLKDNQKLWGSGVSHLIPTSAGLISIPKQSNSFPTITNTNLDPVGNAITLAPNNAISGFVISATSLDAIFGADLKSLDVSSCTITNTGQYTINATFSGDASISVTNNHFLDNPNGILLALQGTSSVICSNNTFQGQTSVFELPLRIDANNNILAALIANNVFNANTVGGIRFNLTDVINAEINILNNIITNTGTGSPGPTFGSSCVIYLPSGTTDNCSVVLTGNVFSGNGSNALYMDASGAFTNLAVTASSNTISNNGGSALALGSSCTNFTLNATNNTITNLNDNGISTASGPSFQTATITINNNTITDIGNRSNGISIQQSVSNLNFTAENNTINRCDGSGIVFYSSEFTNMIATIRGNTISNCQNEEGANAASGISLDTYLNLLATIANNNLSDNTTPGVGIGISSTGNPTVCLTLTGNSSNPDPGYTLTNPGSGAFNLSPCNVDAMNIGTISASGITLVQSCPDATACP